MPISNQKGIPDEQKAIERDRLFKKVSQLQIKVDWFRKKTGYLG